MIKPLFIFATCYLYLVGGIRYIGLYRIYNAMYGDTSSEPITLIIGEQDEHGCIGSAGYSFCNYTKLCHRFDQPCVFNYTNYLSTLNTEKIN
jgi:hypothetical protein